MTWDFSPSGGPILPSNSDAVLDVFLKYIGPCLGAGDYVVIQTIVGLGYWVPSYTGLLPFFFSVLITTHPVLANVAIVMWINFFSNQLLLCYTHHHLPGVSTTGALTACAVYFWMDSRRTKYVPGLRMGLCIGLVVYNLLSVMLANGLISVLSSYAFGLVEAAAFMAFSNRTIAPYYEQIEASKVYQKFSLHKTKARPTPPYTMDSLLRTLHRVQEESAKAA